jgi:choloylglycine hydrolase
MRPCRSALRTAISVRTTPSTGPTVCDLTNRRYFFELTTIPNVVWVDLARVDLSSGAPAAAVDPDDIGLSGDVSSELRPVSAMY